MTQPQKAPFSIDIEAHTMGATYSGTLRMEDPATAGVKPAVGVSYKSDDAKRLLAWLPAPAFRRLYKAPGAGMPVIDRADDSTPPATVPWWSHKDQPDLGAVSTAWAQLAAKYPGKPIRWTFQHEANDLPYDKHLAGWKALRGLRDSHPQGDRIRLVSVLSGYYARFKSNGAWLSYALRDLVDEVAFDLYPQVGYEVPASLFGIVDECHRITGMPVGIAEISVPLLSPASSLQRAVWFGDAYQHAAVRGYTTFGLWHSHEIRDEKKYDYRAHDEETQHAWKDLVTR